MSDKQNVIEVSLSELIAIHRDRLHLSQSELAQAAGISRNYISLIERGHTENISYGVLKRICSKLGLNVSITFNPDEIAS